MGFEDAFIEDSAAKKGLIELGSAKELKNKISSGLPLIVDFSASWCGPCRTLTPILEKLAEERTDVEFLKVDIDSFPELASQHQVTSVPHVNFFKSGQKTASFVGARDKQFITSFIDKNLQ